MKEYIDAFDYAGHICKALKKGILLTTSADGNTNTMTIGWGKIGIEWNKPVFIAYVRESRHTYQMLKKSGAFTVNIPYGSIDPAILSYCGKKSGRDTNKIQDLCLTPIPSDNIEAPAILELPLTLECKVIYTQEQDLSAVPAPLRSRFYCVSDDEHADMHTAFYGEIVSAYLITP